MMSRNMGTGALMHVLVFVIMVCTSVQYAHAMDSPANEFGAGDLVSLGVFQADAVKTPPPRPSSGGARPGVAKGVGTIGQVSSSSVQEALIIATAKVRGAAHFSRPYILVDVEEEGGSCGPYDWIFIASCKGPETNKKIIAEEHQQLPHSYVSIFKLPNKWDNLRVTLPTNGRCGWNGASDRTAFMRIASPTNICMTAGFKYRSCSFWRCTKKDCDRLHMLARYIKIGPSGVETRAYTAYDNGIEICPVSSIDNLFQK